MIFAAGCRARAGQGLADAARQEGEPVQVLAQRRGAVGGWPAQPTSEVPSQSGSRASQAARRRAKVPCA